MNQNRRDFMKSALWLSAAALADGCMGRKMFASGGGSMSGYAAPPMEHIGFCNIGVGGRGTEACARFTLFEGVDVTALADIRPEATEIERKWLKEHGRDVSRLKEYKGKADSWKAACEDPNVDIVYITTPANLHAEMVIYALNCGKHVFVEVPGCETVDEAWEIVEACERNRRHCMLLENCCYGEDELLAFSLCHKGLLGELTHAECAYVHCLTWRNLADCTKNRQGYRGKGMRRGNGYPTHGLGPICMDMDINRGDRLDYLVSMSSKAAAWPLYARDSFPPDAWQNRIKYVMGDMNTSLIRTAMGRTIQIQYDLSTPRPYTRANFIQGSKGFFRGFPYEVGFTSKHGHECYRFAPEKAMEVRKTYRSPLWSEWADTATQDGGHGGMDFMMMLRIVYCLKNGLPMDSDVYDLATWSSICELTRESDIAGGKRVDIPDFTRGAWKTAKPYAEDHFVTPVEKVGILRGRLFKSGYSV